MGSVPEVVADALSEAADVVIAGGVAAVDGAVEASPTAESVARMGGEDRYETGAMSTRAAQVPGATQSPTYAVTGAVFPDALTAGAVVARTGGSMVLLNPAGLDTAPDGSRLLLEAAEATGARARIWLVGGEAALPSTLRAALEALI